MHQDLINQEGVLRGCFRSVGIMVSVLRSPDTKQDILFSHYVKTYEGQIQTPSLDHVLHHKPSEVL